MPVDRVDDAVSVEVSMPPEVGVVSWLTVVALDEVDFVLTSVVSSVETVVPVNVVDVS